MDQRSEKIAEIVFRLRGLKKRIAPDLRIDDLAVLASSITELAGLVAPGISANRHDSGASRDPPAAA